MKTIYIQISTYEPGFFGESFMQDNIFASHTFFGRHMDVNSHIRAR